jgi:hypothetical protein
MKINYCGQATQNQVRDTNGEYIYIKKKHLEFIKNLKTIFQNNCCRKIK